MMSIISITNNNDVNLFMLSNNDYNCYKNHNNYATVLSSTTIIICCKYLSILLTNIGYNVIVVVTDYVAVDDNDYDVAIKMRIMLFFVLSPIMLAFAVTHFRLGKRQNVLCPGHSCC